LSRHPAHGFPAEDCGKGPRVNIRGDGQPPSGGSVEMVGDNTKTT
jgi:hypothetical protein